MIAHSISLQGGPAYRCLAGSKLACGDPIVAQIATATIAAAKIYGTAIRV
jgi:hypothetical protein